jgi:hypothetical protein
MNIFIWLWGGRWSPTFVTGPGSISPLSGPVHIRIYTYIHMHAYVHRLTYMHIHTPYIVTYTQACMRVRARTHTQATFAYIYIYI